LDGGSAVGVAHHKCGESYVDNLVDALGHNYVQSGNVYTCSRCGDSYTGHEHSYTEATTQPTCTTAGYTVYTCSCGDSYTVEIPALGHNYVLVGQSGNVATYECSRCGHRYTAVIPVDPQPPVEYSLRSSNPVTEHHEYVYASGQLMRETITTTANGTSTTEVLDFIYGSGSTPLALVYTNGTANPVTYYFVTNMQGDVVKLVNASGATVASYAYDAWGKVLSATGSMAEVNPIRYRGYYYDAETELYYLQSRYYDSAVKRFVNADAEFDQNAGFTICNLFAYCVNNPVTLKDDTGEGIVLACVVIFAIVGAVAGGGYMAYESKQQLGYVNGWWVAGGALLGGAVGAGAGWCIGQIAAALTSGITSLTATPILSKIYESWQAAEQALRDWYNGTTYRFWTPHGDRILDCYSNGIAMESKYGYQGLTQQIIKEIEKDLWLLTNGVVDSVEWHFFWSAGSNTGGGSKALIEALVEAGFEIIYHFGG